MKMGWVVALLILGGLLLGQTTVSALEGEMAEEFAYLSGQTRQAMDLSPVELEDLVGRCERLLEQTAELQASEKKIMRKRIERLRGLFLYVLESKNAVKEDRPGT